MAVGSISFAYLILLKIVYVIYIPVFLLYLMIRPSDAGPKVKSIQTVLFLTAGALAVGFVAFLNHIRFGSVFETGYPKYAYTELAAFSFSYMIGGIQISAAG